MCFRYNLAMLMWTTERMWRRGRIWWRSRVQHRYWVVLEPNGSDGEFHVIPNNDTIVHEPAGCPCGVTTEACMRDDGSYGWVVTHHSLDGRELDEVNA
jgi:hypothetical protein